MPDLGKDFLAIAGVGQSGTSLERAKLVAQELEKRGEKSGKFTPEEVKEADKVAADFEALLLQQMFGAMWQTAKSEGGVTGSKEEGIFRDMFNQAMAKEASEGQGIGIKDAVRKELLKR